jgi:hypothetical protein
MNFFTGIVFGILGQIMSFLQLQASIKWGWWERYPILVLSTAVPALWLYMKSVEGFITHFNGQVWESRLLGFCIGIVVFSVMSKVLFGEEFTTKTAVSLFLSGCIIMVQLFWK